MIRPWRDGDDVQALTELLHRAYLRHKEAGLFFVATHQNSDVTLDRIRKGECYLAELDGRVVGTICVYLNPDSPAPYHNRPGVALFGQYGVEPELQGYGIGRKLLEHIENRAREYGRTELVLDTSELAHDLIAQYEHWGFRVVDQVKWDEVNYRSVIMAKPL